LGWKRGYSAAPARILTVLPVDHPARTAHERGVDTIRLAHMVNDVALSQALEDAFLAGRRRLFARTEHFKP
jgi:hypothetical protein